MDRIKGANECIGTMPPYLETFFGEMNAFSGYVE